MYAYIAQSSNLYDMDCLSLYGTNSFHLVWEAVCADILDNKLETRLGLLQLPLPLQPQYSRSLKLIDLIEKPYWTATGNTAKDSLVPDLITIGRVGQEYQFLIFDAKYYNTRLDSGAVPKGQPGIESVTKQYLYQMAYQQFVIDQGFSAVRNCFLMPTEGEAVIDKGEVSMKMLSSLGLQNIKVRFLPAAMAYEHYITGRKMDISLLKL